MIWIKYMEQHLISVIVPCYNQAQYLDECLQSVLEQTYTNWECIIVNDGSPDNTDEIAKKWLDKDTRFRYIKKQNGGLSSARNAGIQEARGEWILPLDADDKIANLYLELAQAEFEQGYTVIYCNAQTFGEKNGAWILPEFNKKNLAVGNVIFCSAFYRKADWSKVGGYDESLLTGWEDWEFWISILEEGKTVYKIEKDLFWYRIKKRSMLTTFQEDKNLENRKKALKYIMKKHIDFFIDYICDNQMLLEENRDLSVELSDIKRSRSYKLATKISNWYRLFSHNKNDNG
ncbi:MAG: glycosyltransferase family A protein [Dysgonamonadaceae bacterium]